MKILLISSEDLYKRSSRLAYDQYMALRKGGHSVDVLTKKGKSVGDILSVLESGYPVITNFFSIKNFFRKLSLKFLFWVGKESIYTGGKYYFFYKNEFKPPIPTGWILNKIKKKYDLILITFLQGLLSAYTIAEIYRKLNVPVFFMAVDMSPMTGGCHYFWGCKRYEIGCGCCPAFNSVDEDDFTHQNMVYRLHAFSNMRCAFWGNSWMNQLAERSFSLRNVLIHKGFVVVNEEEFKPMEKSESAIHFGVDDYKYVFFAGAQSLSDPRKGMNLLILALNSFYNKISLNERKRILVLFAGEESEELANSILFKTKFLGYLGFEELVRAYSCSYLFLCPSVLDAGPMMINQALSCGLPVVSFEMGVALDVLKNEGTGYCAKLGDYEDFANGIHFIYSLNELEYTSVSFKCRKIALETTSYSAFCSNIESLYNKFYDNKTSCK